MSDSEASNMRSLKVFVGQIPKTLDENGLRPYFEPYGSVLEISVIRDKQTGSHRGCAFVTYSSKEEAEEAIKSLHNTQKIAPIQNPLQVKIADGELERMNCKLFIGMVPKSFSEEELKPIFEPFGVIEELTILRGQNNQSKGCAFLRYSSREEAAAAITALNGTRLENSSTGLVVKFADTDKTKQLKTKQVPTATAPPPAAALLAQNPAIWQYAQDIRQLKATKDR